MKKIEIPNLAKKVFAVIAASAGVLSSEKLLANGHINHGDSGDPSKGINNQSRPRLKMKPKLILKLNINDPSRHLLAQHSSHSSHSSHQSHISHYSSGGYSGSGGSSDSDTNGGGSILPGVLIVGGIAYGAYLLGKGNNKKQ